jgi:hypothetical protein
VTCPEYEPLVALQLTGDLGDRGVALQVERHLEECAACRELLEDLRASQAMLRELPAADPAFLAAVRTEVLARVGKKRCAMWAWAVPCAAALATAFLVARLGVTPQKPAPVPIVRMPQPLANTARSEAAPVVRGQPPAQIRRGRRRRSRIEAGAPPLVVKMLTDDPNIVIIWLVDQPGD